MTAQPSLSRMQVVPVPQMLPGKCICCGAVDRPCVDFGMSIDRFGVIYFCEDCIGEAARQFGFSSPADAMSVAVGAEQSVNKYLNDNDLVMVSRELYDSCVDSVRSLYDVLPLFRAVAPVEDDSEVLFESGADDRESEPADSGVDGSSDADSNAPKSTAGQKPRTSSKRRPASVPVDSSDEPDFGSSIE